MIDFLQQLLIGHPILAPLIFVFARMLPIIVAPLPGLVVDLVGIAIFGSVYGFILGETSILLASAVTFLIARYFREPVVKKFASLQKIHQWEERLSGRQKFWGLVMFRMATSPAFDYMSYAIGLTKIRFSTYMLATFVGTLPLMASIYFFGGYSIERGLVTTLIFVGTLAAIIFLWGYVLKHYFRKIK